GAAFHVPHGLSNAMLLPAVTAFSIPSASVRYAQCARAMGVATQSDSDEVANQKLINELKALNADLQVPTPADFGIDKEAFLEQAFTMAEQALASGSPANNPKVPTIDEMVSLYHSVYA
ncbi:MAG: iron-containing alcohol dehydrogenase, partial [Pseudomonadota bacterium]|nr:iron-containing alcohol dehydrogenase [Pseudomonadota bacterium]